MSIVNKQLGHSNNEYGEAIEQALKAKYSLSFKVESLGGAYGTYNNTTIKAWCYCEEGNHSNIRFMAEVKKDDLNDVKDSYLNIVAADIVSEEILSLSKKNAKAHSVIETGTYSNDAKIETLDTYLKQLGNYFVTTHFFIEDSASFTTKDYADIVYSIGEKANSLGLRDLCIVVWFVDELSTDIDTTFVNTQLDQLYDEHLGRDYVKHHASVQLTENGISTDYESLTSAFEKDVK